MKTGLEIKNLSKSYKTFALEKVSFKLPKGAIMGLIGENGAGKTTLLNAILGVTPYNSGEILVDGNEQNEMATKETIGFVPDANFFQDYLRPNELGKIMSGVYRQWNTKEYKEYLQAFSIDESKKIKELSLGMKKKLLLATALCHNAKLLVLDEMMNGLDPVARSEIRDILMDYIQDEEHSVLISSHITEDLEKISDYITLLHNGKIVLCQNKDTLLQQYGILKCGKQEFSEIASSDYIGFRTNTFGCEALVRDRFAIEKKYKNAVIDNVKLEDIMIFMARSEKA